MAFQMVRRLQVLRCAGQTKSEQTSSMTGLNQGLLASGLRTISRICAVPIFLFMAGSVNASSINLTWNANTESDLAGYRIYFGTFSLIDISTEDARANPSISIWEVAQTTTTTVYLKGGTTYYFRATAFDQSRNESGFNVDLSSGATEVSYFPKRGDLNGDDKVDILDLGILVKDYK